MSSYDLEDPAVKEKINEYTLSETEGFEDTLKKRKKYDKYIRTQKAEDIYLYAKFGLLFGCPIVSTILCIVIIFFPKLNHDIKYSKEIAASAMGIFIGLIVNKDGFTKTK